MVKSETDWKKNTYFQFIADSAHAQKNKKKRRFGARMTFVLSVDYVAPTEDATLTTKNSRIVSVWKIFPTACTPSSRCLLSHYELAALLLHCTRGKWILWSATVCCGTALACWQSNSLRTSNKLCPLAGCRLLVRLALVQICWLLGLGAFPYLSQEVLECSIMVNNYQKKKIKQLVTSQSQAATLR